MLIQFNFKNFKSFREEATLDLSAAKMTEFSDRVVTVGSEKILPVAAIYGANASGKSNIYNAFEYMSDYVADSFKYGDEEEKFEEFRPTPFLFDSTSADAESSFEIYFTLPGDKSERTYNYGFCINKEEFIRQGINVSLISNACDVDTKEAVGIREGAGVGHLGSINTVLARMDLKLEKEEFAALINRTFIENVSVQSSDNSVYVVISASRRKKLQQTMQKFEKKYGQVIWIVPYMTGGEYSLDYCGIRPEGWEVK